MAGTWRLAKSLEVLRDQVNALYPSRAKASDGTIGDARHAATGSASDHNPNEKGVVAAVDFTNDPAHGLDIEQLAQQLIQSRDPRIKFIVFNRKIVIPSSVMGWSPRTYMGDNPHDKHIHISVWGDYDDQTKWNLKGATTMKPDEEFLKVAYLLLMNREATPEALNSLRGFQKPVEVLYALDRTPDRKKLIQKLNDYDRVKAERDELDKEVTKVQLERDALKGSKADPDAVQLKELIKKIVKE